MRNDPMTSEQAEKDLCTRLAIIAENWQSVVPDYMRDTAIEAKVEIERLRKTLDKIAGVCLGCDATDMPAAKIHKMACDALAPADA
jgi:hypothetical protein